MSRAVRRVAKPVSARVAGRSRCLPYGAPTAGAVGGDGTVLQYDLSSIRPDVERTAALGNVDIDLSDSLTLSFQLAHSESDSQNYPANGALGPFGGGVRIRPDNAYLTPALQADLPFGGVMNRIFAPDVISATNTTEAETTRFVASVEGALTASSTSPPVSCAPPQLTSL